MSLKNLVTPPGIDAGTVGLVAQRLDHYATPGPFTYNIASEIWSCIVVNTKIRVFWDVTPCTHVSE